MKVERVIVGSFEVCCYLAFCEKTGEGVIIDPGEATEELKSLIKKLDFKPVYILATHAHADHVAGVEELRKWLNIPYLVHREDEEFFSIPENFAMFRAWGFSENPKADRVFEDGDVIKFGEEYLKVIHTPGHSPGSVCFYNEENKFLFTGDTLFVGAVGRADITGGDYFKMMESIINKLLKLPEDTIIFPGHDYGIRPTSTIREEKRTNPFILEFLEE